MCSFFTLIEESTKQLEFQHKREMNQINQKIEKTNKSKSKLNLNFGNIDRQKNVSGQEHQKTITSKQEALLLKCQRDYQLKTIEYQTKQHEANMMKIKAEAILYFKQYLHNQLNQNRKSYTELKKKYYLDVGQLSDHVNCCQREKAQTERRAKKAETELNLLLKEVNSLVSMLNKSNSSDTSMMAKGTLETIQQLKNLILNLINNSKELQDKHLNYVQTIVGKLKDRLDIQFCSAINESTSINALQTVLSNYQHLQIASSKYYKEMEQKSKDMVCSLLQTCKKLNPDEFETQPASILKRIALFGVESQENNMRYVANISSIQQLQILQGQFVKLVAALDINVDNLKKKQKAQNEASSCKVKHLEDCIQVLKNEKERLENKVQLFNQNLDKQTKANQKMKEGMLEKQNEVIKLKKALQEASKQELVGAQSKKITRQLEDLKVQNKKLEQQLAETKQAVDKMGKQSRLKLQQEKEKWDKKIEQATKESKSVLVMLQAHIQKFKFKEVNQTNKTSEKFQIFFERINTEINAKRLMSDSKVLEENFDLRCNLVNILNYNIKSPILRAKKIYEFDSLNPTNVHRYIDSKPHLVLLIRLRNNCFVGGYSFDAYEVNHREQMCQGFIFNLNNNKVFKANGPVALYHDQHIVFGNHDIKISIHTEGPTMYTAFGMSKSHFCTSGQPTDFIRSDNREISVEHFEIYQLIFAEK